jgi:hypothetical protein
LMNGNLQKLDSDYKDIKMMLGRDPLRVTLLPIGAFGNYRQISNDQLVKMNPSSQNIDILIKCG